jgi:metal-responsive CopG/Arc/MetJ family transcriptional regulator
VNYKDLGQLKMPKQNKEYLGISVDKDVLEEIEQRRGLIKRSTYVNDLLRKLLSDHSGTSNESDKSSAYGHRLEVAAHRGKL